MAGADLTPQKWLDGGLQVAARLVAALDALGAGEPYALRRLIEASEEAAELLSELTGLVVEEGAA